MTVTRAAPLAPVAVDGLLQLVGRAQVFLVALVGIQVFHISGEGERGRKKERMLHDGCLLAACVGRMKSEHL